MEAPARGSARRLTAVTPSWTIVSLQRNEPRGSIDHYAMTSKTRLLGLVKSHSAKEVAAALRDSPSLLNVRDRRGRGWLHVCCGVNIKTKGLTPAVGIATAAVLLDAGLDLEEAAFTEKDFRATALWYAVAWGKNVRLAKFLLERGADPRYCLWAAAFNDDVAVVRLLVRHGAPLDASAEDASPLLFAVQWGRFAAAEELLKLGADVNFRSSKSVSPLHHMLKTNRDRKHFRMIAKYRPRVDLPDHRGITAAAIMRRKRDGFFHGLADELEGVS